MGRGAYIPFTALAHDARNAFRRPANPRVSPAKNAGPAAARARLRGAGASRPRKSCERLTGVRGSPYARLDRESRKHVLPPSARRSERPTDGPPTSRRRYRPRLQDLRAQEHPAAETGGANEVPIATNVNAIPLDRDTVLRRGVELGASDLLFTAGHPVMAQVAGVLGPLAGSPVLSALDARRLAESFLTPALHERFLRDLELDTRHFLPGIAHFRVNLFIQRGHWAAVVRIIPLRIPLPEEIGLPAGTVARLLGITRGLVLVTGPTGCGKSTTIASLLEQLNQSGPARHIVTIEDPIEFVFEPRHAVIEQREVGVDTKTYARGLRGALRQMPHVIFVGEMRDLTSMSMALSAAETGNLVISTMATQSAAQTVTRIVDSFPPHQQSQIRAQLSLSLRAVVSQLLLPRRDGQGRVAAREILFGTQAIANLIRDDKVHQIPNAIATGMRDDMIPLDDALGELVDRSLVEFEVAYPHFSDTEKRDSVQKRVYRTARVEGHP